MRCTIFHNHSLPVTLLGFSILLTFLSAVVYAQPSSTASVQSWADAKKAGKGFITVFWNDASPFISKNASGNMEGIEYDLLMGFKNYLERVHHTNVEIRWNEQ